MPLIAIDILEEKIKELIIIINRLKEENKKLKNELSQVPETTAVSPESSYEIETLKKQLEKFKADRNLLYTKIASAVRHIDEMQEKK